MSSRYLVPGVAAVLVSSVSAFAADLPAKVAPVLVEEHCKAAISTPAFGGLIKANPNPACFTTGFGDIYVGGAVTGYAYTYSNPNSLFYSVPGVPDERFARVDISNLQGWIQKADGPLQFYVHAGVYSIPVLGLPTFSAFDQTDLLFGPVPVAFGKYQINDEFSIQGGRMFTNIGTELLFSYQNLNITRGLLFNQENFINHGVQVNYASGPWAASLAVTDGFFSGELNWVTGLITYKIDDSNTVGINGGTNFNSFNSAARSLRFQYATPFGVQNSSIVSVNYTYANGPWIVTPYVQYTNIDLGEFGLPGAETFGGAILAGYTFTENFALAGRFEYITQNGSPLNQAATFSALYGAGSSAYSFTITPTFTWDRYFLRGEFSHVQLEDFARGDAFAGGPTVGLGFGRLGNRDSQQRYVIETGFTF